MANWALIPLKNETFFAEHICLQKTDCFLSKQLRSEMWLLDCLNTTGYRLTITRLFNLEIHLVC